MDQPETSKSAPVPVGDWPTRLGSDRRRLARWAATTAIVLVMVIQLRIQQRLWWCACGESFLWSGDTWSRHNSQHLFDPYVFTHALHGLLFYGLLVWACPRLALGWRFALAVGVEAAWEVIENTELVIQRYRSVTASLDYLGDTVANSLGDVLGFAAGFWLAGRLGLRRSIVAFLATELLLLFWIRDGLLLNVLMLLWPIDAIRNWQVPQ